MAKVLVFSVKGVKSGSLDFPEELTAKPNMNLIAQSIHVYEDRSHKGTSKAKTRSQVFASGAKIYKQKGTGGARHGDVKAPIFVGGGVAHGPKGVKRILKMPQKLRARVLKMLLDLKIKNQRLVLVDKLESLNKTKDSQVLLSSIHKAIGIDRPIKTLLSVAKEKTEAIRNFRNIEGVTVGSWSNLNPYTVFTSNLIIIDRDVLKKETKSKREEDSIKTKKPSSTVRKNVKNSASKTQKTAKKVRRNKK